MNSQSQPARLRPFRPQPFGRYTLLSHLATGGMGEIYLARLEGAQGFEKLCVIKKILPQLAADPDFVERFVGEARTLVKLSHGSIAQVLDMGLHEGEAYMALEYVDGKDLRKVAARVRDRQTPLPLTFILYVMGRVLDALAYAHRKRDDDEKELKLVHRDISPQNILISYEGEVKVIDFGLAKSRLSAAKTNPSIILGKFLYMSPEQARHQPVDRRSDLYAVGLCLYELISGKNPFDAVPPGELMSTVANPKVAPLNEVEPLTPSSVAQLVGKALAVDPAQRFQTAEEFRGRLQGCLMEIDASAGPESVSRFMRDLFASDFQSERRLLSSLKEAPRLGPEPRSGVSEGAAVRPMVPTLPPKTIRLDGPVEPLSFRPTPRSREDGGPVRDDGETRPGVMVDESTRPAFPVEQLEEAARVRARPNPASDTAPSVEVRAEDLERGEPVRAPAPVTADAAQDLRPASAPTLVEMASVRPASAPTLVEPIPAIRAGVAEAPPPARPPSATVEIPAAVLPPEAYRLGPSAPVPVVPPTPSAPVAPPALAAPEPRAAAEPEEPFMVPPPLPDGPFADEEYDEAPPAPGAKASDTSAYPWTESKEEEAPPAAAMPEARPAPVPESHPGEVPRAEVPPAVEPPRAPPSEARPPEPPRTASLQSMPAVAPPRPAPEPRPGELPRAASVQSMPAVAPPRPAPEPRSGELPRTASVQSMPAVAPPRPAPAPARPGASPATPATPTPAVASSPPSRPAVASVAPLASDVGRGPPPRAAAPTPEALYEDTSPRSNALPPEEDDDLPVLTADSVELPEDERPSEDVKPPEGGRLNDADTHPRINMPRGGRNDDTQPRVVLDESFMRDAEREQDAAPARPKTGVRRVRASSPGMPARGSTSSGLRAVAPRPAPVEPAVDEDEEDAPAPLPSHDETRRTAMPVRPDAEARRPEENTRRTAMPAPREGSGRPLLVFAVLLVLGLAAAAAALMFIPPLRALVGLDIGQPPSPAPPQSLSRTPQADGASAQGSGTAAAAEPTPASPEAAPKATADAAPVPPPAQGDPSAAAPAAVAAQGTAPAAEAAPAPASEAAPAAPTTEAAPAPAASASATEEDDGLLPPVEPRTSKAAVASAPPPKRQPPSRASKRERERERPPARGGKELTPLQKEWSATSALYQKLVRDHDCASLRTACLRYGPLLEEVNAAGDVNDAKTLVKVRKLRVELQQRQKELR